MYEIYGYENYQTVVKTIFCKSLDEASNWADENLGKRGWSVIVELEIV
jgi:hypothetical protein